MPKNNKLNVLNQIIKNNNILLKKNFKKNAEIEI
jgi:hypothetical protein